MQTDALPQLSVSVTKARYQKKQVLMTNGARTIQKILDIQTGKIHTAAILSKKKLRPEERRRLTEEISLVQSLNHQRLIRLEDFFEDEEEIYLLFEKSRTILSDVIDTRRKIPEADAKNILVQLIDALKYLHNNRVIHRDIKPQNVYLSYEGEVMLGEFTLAAKLSLGLEKRAEFCGAPNYIAPEILLDNREHSFEVDLWSLGVTAYEILVGKAPFEMDSIEKTFEKIRGVKFAFPKDVEISASAKDFVSKLLVKDPKKRLTLDDALAHPFLSGVVPSPMSIYGTTTNPSENQVDQETPVSLILHNNAPRYAATSLELGSLPGVPISSSLTDPLLSHSTA